LLQPVRQWGRAQSGRVEPAVHTRCRLCWGQL